MKIGFVFDDSLERNDGVQQYIKTVGKWLMSSGHEVRYLVGETKDAGEFQPFVYSLSKNRQVSGNKNKLSIPLPAYKQQIINVLDKEKFDVLHVQAPYSPFLAAKVIKLADKNTAVVASFHIVGESWRERLGLKLLSMIEKSSLHRIDQFLAVSSAAEIASRGYFPKQAQVKISSNVVDISRFHSAFSPKRGNKLVYLGRLVERKGALHLIEAINILNKNDKFQDYHLLIAGDGPQRNQVEALISKYQLSAKVTLLGFIDESAKPELLADADLAIFPSTGGESFGIVLIEAMAAGALTIGGANEGYSTVLNGQPSTLFDPRDHQTFATTIEQYLHNHKLRAKAYEWQAKRVQDFSIDKVGPKLVDIYRAVIVKRTGA